MKTVIAALALLFATSTNLIAQDAGMKQNIEKAARNPKTEERAAKADALLTSKRRLINSDTIGNALLNKNNKTTCNARKSGQRKQD